MPPPPFWAPRIVELEIEGGLKDVMDLSKLREGEAARREAREWVEGAERVVLTGKIW